MTYRNERHPETVNNGRGTPRPYTRLSRSITLSLLLALTFSNPAPAQDTHRESLTRMGQAMSRVVVKAKKVTEKLNYGFYENGCVYGVMLRPGSSATETFTLQAGQSYLFIASGDRTARNVDIVIRNAQGKVVGQDIEADVTPFVLFQPKTGGSYTMSLNLKSSWKGPAFCAVTLMRKGGINLPLENIVQAAIKMDYAADKLLRDSDNGRFNQDPNTWGLYGAVMRPGQTVNSKPKTYRAARRGIVAVGDSNVVILDAALLNSQRKVIAKNKKIGATAEIIHEMSAGTYSVSTTNRGSSSPALLMTALLDLPAKKAQLTPTPSMASIIPETSPFAGKWQGEWSGEPKGKENSIKMTIKSDGSLTGRFANPTLKTNVKFTGLIGADGAITLDYKKDVQAYIAEGRLQFVGEGQKQVEGKLAFSTLGVEFGKAEFVVSREE